MKRRSFDTNTGKVVYWIDASSGADSRWLVFLPGLTADHTLFDAQMMHFSGKVNSLVWDAPAHGLSRPFPLDFSMDDYAHWLHGILNAEGVEHPILVGQSLGGYVSQAFIDLYPCEAAGFVAVDSAPLKRKWTAGEGIPIVWVPGAGHNSNVDAPDFVNGQIESFIARL